MNRECSISTGLDPVSYNDFAVSLVIGGDVWLDFLYLRTGYL